jgi:hypothetical protein
VNDAGMSDVPTEQIDQIVNVPTREARLWTPLAIAVYGLVLAYPSSLLLAVKTWRQLERRDRIVPHLLGAFALSVPLVILMALAPRAGRWAVLGANIVAFSYLKETLKADIQEFSASHPEAAVRFRPWYTAFGWALLGIVALFVMAISIAIPLEIATALMAGE